MTQTDIGGVEIPHRSRSGCDMVPSVARPLGEGHMAIHIRRLAGRLAFAGAALALIGTVAPSQDNVVKIGVLSDMSDVYSDLAGPGSVIAAKMAVEDFNPAAHGMKVEIVSADHQNKQDIGAKIARRGAGGERGCAGKEQGVPGLRRGYLRFNRAETLA